MKNMKKIAALVIVLAMALSTVAFGATYTDVSADASYSEAVEVMSALGLLKGYKDGTFGPDKTITRAEFAAVVVRALGMEDAAAGAATATSFTDVPASHWAAGYVKIANQQGIIAGYGDGTFGPDDEVTYEQAVKMLVCALGYAPMFANVADAYPTAYLAQANTLGVTNGVSAKIGDKASRAIVARLAYNSLDKANMAQDGFGSEVSYSQDKSITLLANNLRVLKFEGTVAPAGFDAENAGKVYIENISNIANGDDEPYDDIYNPEGDNLRVAEGVEIPVGYTVTVYADYSEDEEDMVVLAIVPKAGTNKTLTLVNDQMKDSEADKDSDEIKYWVTSSLDNDTKTIKIDLTDTTDDPALAVYENKSVTPMKWADVVANFKAGKYPVATFINNDKDSAYDVLLVDYYESGLVTKIAERTYKVTSSNGKASVTLDPEDEDSSFSIKDTTGKELTFADIAVDDVITVMISKDADGNEYKEVIISSDVVEGTVSEDLGNNKYVINDKEYKSSKGITLEAGDKGIFYVDPYGTIVGKTLDASSRTFGMIYGIYDVSDYEDEKIYEVTMYTSAGKFESLAFAKNFEIDGYKGKNDNMSETSGTISSETGASINNEAQVVMYSVNANNEITAINTGAKIYDATEFDYNYKNTTTAKYDAYDAALDGATVTDSTVVLANKLDTLNSADPKMKRSDFSNGSKAIFVDEDTYSVEYVIDEETEEIVFVVVNGATAKADADATVMYVSAATGKSVDDDGNSIVTVTGFVDGVKKTIKLAEDVNVYGYKADGTDEGTDPDVVDYTTADIGLATVIQYNEADYVPAVKILATQAQVTDWAEGNNLGYQWGTTADNDKIGSVYVGNLVDYKNGRATFADSERIKVDSSVYAMYVDASNVDEDTDEIIISRIYGNYVIDDAEYKENVYDADETTDDIIVIYSYDKDAYGVVIIDVKGDNN